jgi:hypothetical protein
MSAIVTPTTRKSTVKHFSVVAAALVAALVLVIVLAISASAGRDSGGSETPTRASSGTEWPCGRTGPC